MSEMARIKIAYDDAAGNTLHESYISFPRGGPLTPIEQAIAWADAHGFPDGTYYEDVTDDVMTATLGALAEQAMEMRA